MRDVGVLRLGTWAAVRAYLSLPRPEGCAKFLVPSEGKDTVNFSQTLATFCSQYFRKEGKNIAFPTVTLLRKWFHTELNDTRGNLALSVPPLACPTRRRRTCARPPHIPLRPRFSPSPRGCALSGGSVTSGPSPVGFGAFGLGVARPAGPGERARTAPRRGGPIAAKRLCRGATSHHPPPRVARARRLP